MKICLLGLGYIGLPTAVLLTHAGHQVLGVDVNHKIIEAIERGSTTIQEPGLQVKFEEALARGTLIASTTPDEADAFLLAVPTPITPSKTADLSYVESALRSILPFLKSGNLVIVESTIPPGCMEDLVIPLLETTGLKVGEELLLAYCPERVIPGKALQEMVENARVVGGYNERSTNVAAELYRTFVQGPIHHTTMNEAVLVKLAENAYRDVNIAFANTLANLCEASDIDARQLIRLANQHPRVNILDPGPGVGGHCIPVDPWFLVQGFPQDTALLKTAREVNDQRVDRVVRLVTTAFQDVAPERVRLAALGVSYKANVADMRESPAYQVVRKLQEMGYGVAVSDPVVKSLPDLPLVSPREAAEGAHGLLCLVKHNRFREFPLSVLEPRLQKPAVVVDLCGYWP